MAWLQGWGGANPAGGDFVYYDASAMIRIREKNMRSRTLLAFVALAVMLAAAGFPLAAQEKVETVEQSYRMDPGKPIELVFRDVDGLLLLRPSADNTISVKVRKEALIKDAKKADRLLRETVVDLDQRGNAVSVRIRYPRLRGIFFWVSDMSRIKIVSEISVPAGTRVRADLVDGSISGDGVRADLRLDVTDGDIRLEGFAGRLDAGTVDGRITVSGELRGLRLETIDGDVRIEAAPGSIMSDDWTVRTADGDIDLSLPPGFSADLSVQGDGRLETLIPLEGVKPFSREKADRPDRGRRQALQPEDGGRTDPHPLSGGAGGLQGFFFFFPERMTRRTGVPSSPKAFLIFWTKDFS